MYFFIALLATFVSCSIMSVKKFTDEAIKPYVARFEALYGDKVDNMSIMMDDLDNGAVGVCISYQPHYREIRVDRGWWARNASNDLALEELVFHELGHCVLNRGHVGDIRDTDEGIRIPMSIMYPYVFGRMGFYSTYHDYYINELFHPAQASDREEKGMCEIKEMGY